MTRSVYLLAFLLGAVLLSCGAWAQTAGSIVIGSRYSSWTATGVGTVQMCSAGANECMAGSRAVAVGDVVTCDFDSFFTSTPPADWGGSVPYDAQCYFLADGNAAGGTPGTQAMDWSSVPMLLQVLIVCAGSLAFMLGYRSGDKV